MAEVTMETNTGEAEGSSEDISGKKKSRFKVLRTRLFGRIKRKGNNGAMKQSQSASDITAPGGVRGGDDSGDEFVYSQGTLGSRAMSHDSIFLADQSLSPPEPVRILSQENVHGRIKALQMKLQQQNIRLGPPPLLIPGKRVEDAGASSEDDGLPHSPPDTSLSMQEGLSRAAAQKFQDTHRHHSSLSLAGTGSEEEQESSQPPSRPLSPVARPAPQPTGSVPPAAPSPASSPGVDFDSPAHFTPCLDNSAARHRMSVKPRNQRASTKGRRLPSSSSRPRSESLNALDRSLPEREEEEDSEISKETIRCRSYSTQVLRSGEALRDPALGKLSLAPAPKLPEGSPKGPRTEPHRRKSSGSQQPFGEPLELEGRVTTNPLFLQPMPRGLHSSWEPDSVPGSATDTSISAAVESEKPMEAAQESISIKRSSVTQSQESTDLVREILSNSKQRNNLNNASPPVLESAPAKSPSLKLRQTEHLVPTSSSHRDGLTRSVQGLTQEPQDQLQAKHQPPGVPGAPCTAKTLPLVDKQSMTPRTSSLKRNTASAATVGGSVKEISCPESAQRISVPPAGLEDQTPAESDNIRKQRPTTSGSFRFSISSAWDRPRGGSFKDKDGQMGVKSEDGSGNKTPLDHRADTQGREDRSPRGPGREAGDRDAKSGRVVPETAREAEGGKEIKETQSRTAQEVGEEEERTAFGVKLRSTSLSLKYRSDAAKAEVKSQHCSGEVHPNQPQNPQSSPHPQLSTKHPCPQQQQESSSRSFRALKDESEDKGNVVDNQTSKPLLPKKLNSDPPKFPTDPPLTSSSLPKCENRDKERTGSFKQGDTGVPMKPASTPPREAEPQVSEPAWMTMAREKTRSLQQLFTSKLPREFTAPASAPKPVAQPASQPTPWPAAQAAPQQGSQQMPRQQVQPSTQPAQQQLPRQPVQPTTQPTHQQMPRPASHSMPQQAQLPVPKQTAQPTTQSSPQVPAHGRADGTPLPQGMAGRSPTPQGKVDRTPQMDKRMDSAPLVDKRGERTDKSFLLGGKTEPRQAPPSTNVARESLHRAPGDSKIHSTDTVPSTTPLQLRDREDRRQMRTETPPSSMSGGGQPSWMELAKRKSLAWSDKTMD